MSPRVLPHGVASICVLIVAGLLAACSGKPPSPPASSSPHDVTLTREQQQRMHVVEVEPSDYRTSIATTGVVDFNRDHAAEVPAPFSGAVTKVLVTLGDSVRAGQPLALVDSPDFTSAIGAYRKAVAAASAADAIAANDRELFAHQAISERENAQAQADAAAADADRAAALQALVALHMDPATIADVRAGKSIAHGAGVIRAPIAGTVVAKSIAPGQTLEAGSTPCFTIADTGSMWVEARLFGDEVASVHDGDSAAVDAGTGGKPIDGKVTNVGAVVDPDTRSVTARVAVDNPDRVLKKGMYVSVLIRSRAESHGLLVPVSAVLRDEENLPFVYVQASGGGYRRRGVTLGERVGDLDVIPAGLHAGDKVVVDGSIFLQFIQTQ